MLPRHAGWSGSCGEGGGNGMDEARPLLDLKETFRFENERMSNEQLLERLASQDGEPAAMPGNRLEARATFDAEIGPTRLPLT
jgi:hypothetical protein